MALFPNIGSKLKETVDTGTLFPNGTRNGIWFETIQSHYLLTVLSPMPWIVSGTLYILSKYLEWIKSKGKKRCKKCSSHLNNHNKRIHSENEEKPTFIICHHQEKELGSKGCPIIVAMSGTWSDSWVHACLDVYHLSPILCSCYLSI